jgi:hypothetical protein
MCISKPNATLALLPTRSNLADKGQPVKVRGDQIKMLAAATTAAPATTASAAAPSAASAPARRTTTAAATCVRWTVAIFPCVGNHCKLARRNGRQAERRRRHDETVTRQPRRIACGRSCEQLLLLSQAFQHVIASTSATWSNPRSRSPHLDVASIEERGQQLPRSQRCMGTARGIPVHLGQTDSPVPTREVQCKRTCRTLPAARFLSALATVLKQSPHQRRWLACAEAFVETWMRRAAKCRQEAPCQMLLDSSRSSACIAHQIARFPPSPLWWDRGESVYRARRGKVHPNSCRVDQMQVPGLVHRIGRRHLLRGRCRHIDESLVFLHHAICEAGRPIIFTGQSLCEFSATTATVRGPYFPQS